MIPQDWDYKKKGSLGDLAVILGSKAVRWPLPFLYVPKRIGTKEVCEERQRKWQWIKSCCSNQGVLGQNEVPQKAG